LTPSYFAALGMWAAMTAAMMAPVVAPWVVAAGRMEARRSGGGVVAAAAPFAGGYGLAWAGFAALAALAQSAVAAAGAPTPFVDGAPALAAVVLVLAGAYQLTALKRACLKHCRSPAGFLLARWRPGGLGRARLGLEHGLYCVACCWALMTLAFAVGMASLLWMGLTAFLMLAETALPGGARLTKPAGIALIVAGAGMLVLARPG